MKRRGFTLIEVLVVVAIIALLVAILLPSLNRAREVSRRTICLHNLKMLGQCWQMYHMENKGHLIGAAAYHHQESDPNFLQSCAPSWVRWIGTTPESEPIERQQWSLRNGAMYKYVRSLESYHCPAIQKGEIRTYSANWGIAPYTGIYDIWNGRSSRRIDQLKRPGARMVFIDDFPEDWDAVWTITPYKFQFWNQIASRHDKGITLGFADGHSELWRWVDQETIKYASAPWRQAVVPAPNDKNRDIKRLQLASWGKLDNSGVK